MWLYACCGLLCPAYPQHFAHGSVNKIPGYPGRAGTLTGRPHTNAGAAPKPQRVEEERRNVTG
ncbi:hypothetical protein A6853_19360 [Salmonella enterica]|nr:hypothetical protein [Salmonella enterica]